MTLRLVDVSTNVLRIQFLLDISPALKQEVQIVVTFLYFKFAKIGWYTVSYNSVQVHGTNSEENKVSKL